MTNLYALYWTHPNPSANEREFDSFAGFSANGESFYAVFYDYDDALVYERMGRPACMAPFVAMTIAMYGVSPIAA